MSISESWDKEIRAAAHKELLAHAWNEENTIVIDELGLEHGRKRIDIAVVNSGLHGYEIKSSRDNLKRLDSQIKSYINYFQKLTIVTAQNHLEKVLAETPEWVEILLVKNDEDHNIFFETIREAGENLSLDKEKLLHLLWRRETLELIKQINIVGNYERKSRKELYKVLADHADLAQVLKWITKSLVARENWRSVQPVAPYDDLCRPVSRYLADHSCSSYR